MEGAAKQEGLSTYWDKNGNKRDEVQYKDNKIVSRKQTWWDEDGKQYSKLECWNENGQEESLEHYKDGELISRKEF